MNDFKAFVEPVTGAGFRAMIRLAHNGKAEPIKNKGGKPAVFPSEAVAYRRIAELLLSYLNGNMVRDGEVAGRTMSAAEATFKVEKKRARTRTITVAYKRGKADAEKA